MYRRCIALILGMALLLFTIPVRIEHNGLAEEISAEVALESSAVHEASILPPEMSTETPDVIDVPPATAEPKPMPEAAAEATAEPTADIFPKATTKPTFEDAPKPTIEPTPEAALETTANPIAIEVSENPVEPTPEAPTTTPLLTPSPIAETDTRFQCNVIKLSQTPQ